MTSGDTSRQAAALRPAVTPFAREDLARTFDAKMMQRARGLLLAGAVRLDGPGAPIEATVRDGGQVLRVTIMPVRRGRQTIFERRCDCERSLCAHTAAAAMLLLDQHPEWRRPTQASLFDLLTQEPPEAAPQRQYLALWKVEPGIDQTALFVSAGLFDAAIAEAGQEDADPATMARIIDDAMRNYRGDLDRSIARLLGGGAVMRVPVPKGEPDLVDIVLKRLVATGRLIWRDGRRLAEGPRRVLRGFRDPVTRRVRPTGLPGGSVLIRGNGFWYVDPSTGILGPAELQVVSPPKRLPEMPAPARGRAGARRGGVPSSQGPTDAATIIQRTPRILTRLSRVETPDEGIVDALHLVFDYGDPGRPAEIDAEDQRQFARIETSDGTVLFARRDKPFEQAALDRLREEGFGLRRLAPAKGSLEARSVRVHAFRGRDAAERWHGFVTTTVPALQAEGWSIDIPVDFGSRVVTPEQEIALAIEDAGEGWFDLDAGVEIEGERRPLLPILAQLIQAGGLAAARIVNGYVHIRLEGGRILALPVDRLARVMEVLEAMLDAGQHVGDRVRLPMTEADTLLDAEDVLAKRLEDVAPIKAYLQRFRDDPPPPVALPATFCGELRPYQGEGLAWLQQLRANGVNGILADDMGLGKTAQTLAHIAVEEAEGRLTDPVLVVVPTSLVPNWASEAARFTPHLKVLILHGLDRHGRRNEIAEAKIVITTYAILSRDIELMRGYPWHLVVLDEAQAIKNPEAKATRAVCSLTATHRLCLSGTPVENNLMELWSQFAFLMPGLLGDRRSFQKRFRGPIEKQANNERAAQLARRIRPFLLRRTKTAVAKELPPKTEIIRRVELEPGQRDLYETIRLSVHEKVRTAIAATGLARNAITVLDALLKLRQVCCDPRLVKLDAARAVSESAKLSCLVDMVKEMVPEGRRILIFSQFTSMLDLIKPELEQAGIGYVELTGSTADRALPVEQFQHGDVAVFLISLKAGGRGLNLTAADTVIHYDPWWNPAAEDQATDRAHRIGQDKPVFVYKLIAAKTVEDRIIELQRRKGNLAMATIEGTSLAGVLGEGDVDYLFGSDGERESESREA